MKTIDSIIADIRANAEAQYEAWQGDPNSFPDGQRWSDFLLEVAKQLEDAHKLEQAETILRASGEAVKLAYEKWHRPGDTAKLREMLKASRDYFVALREKVQGSLSEQYLTQRIANIDVALAAPARNCDRFATFDEAKAEFDRTHEVLKFSYYELHKWLFAPEGKEASNG